MSFKRYLGTAGAAALLALSLTACGDDDVDAPTDASAEDFCETVTSAPESDSDDPGKQAEAANELGDKLEDVGSPEDMSDDARSGFESYVKALKDLDEDKIKDLSEAGGDDEVADTLGVDGDEFQALSEYIVKTCTSTDAPAE